MRLLDGVRTREEGAAELGRILAIASRPGCGGWAIREREGRAWVGKIGMRFDRHAFMYREDVVVSVAP
jgi:hypothetical protein